MTISEQSRHELYLRLEAAVGTEAAATLMGHLPPVGWADVATKRDLDAQSVATKHDLDALGAETRHSIDALAAQTRHSIDALGAEIGHRIDGLEASTAHSIASLDEAIRQLEERQLMRSETMENRLRASMFEAINSALTSQTRTILLGIIGSNLSFAALAFAAATLR